MVFHGAGIGGGFGRRAVWCGVNGGKGQAFAVFSGYGGLHAGRHGFARLHQERFGTACCIRFYRFALFGISALPAVFTPSRRWPALVQTAWLCRPQKRHRHGLRTACTACLGRLKILCAASCGLHGLQFAAGAGFGRLAVRRLRFPLRCCGAPARREWFCRPPGRQRNRLGSIGAVCGLLPCVGAAVWFCRSLGRLNACRRPFTHRFTGFARTPFQTVFRLSSR
ncbi:hypothetical protein AABM17_1915 [Neisseria musculi]|uniref:Uncharacterized protein n=1 Tax=Neisseria musculi TaxID=1815583 RepID=A0A7H1M9U4_9NEIS|nr:hypothetical protein H7A79_1915 [Neisseria musculi]